MRQAGGTDRPLESASLKERGEEGRELTFYRDLPAAGQVCLVAHQDDGHVVGPMRAPQLDAEL